MDAQKKKLLDLVDSKKDQIVQTCQDLIRLPSISGNEKDVSEYVVRKLRDLGIPCELYEAEKDRPNVVGNIQFGDGGPIILLNEHLDVVPPGAREDWDDDPFSAVIRGGKIFGRGAVDPKSGVATMLMAIDCLLSYQTSLKGEIIIAATVDEEKGSTKGTLYLLDRGLIKKADMGIVFEPTNMRFEIAQRGTYWAKIKTSGKTAHGGRPWLGVSAIDHMMEVMIELKKLEAAMQEKSKHPYVASPSISIGTICGGEHLDIVARDCEIEYAWGLMPDETDRDVDEKLDQILNKLIHEKSMKITRELFCYWPGAEISKDEPVVVGLRRAFIEALGREPVIAGKDVPTDASYFKRRLGIPTMIFSPGDGFLAHTANEHIEIDKLINAVKVVSLFLHEQLKDQRA